MVKEEVSEEVYTKFEGQLTDVIEGKQGAELHNVQSCGKLSS